MKNKTTRIFHIVYFFHEEAQSNNPDCSVKQLGKTLHPGKMCHGEV